MKFQTSTRNLNTAPTSNIKSAEQNPSRSTKRDRESVCVCVCVGTTVGRHGALKLPQQGGVWFPHFQLLIFYFLHFGCLVAHFGNVFWRMCFQFLVLIMAF